MLTDPAKYGPAHREQFVVQCLRQGLFGMWTGGVGKLKLHTL